MRKGFKLNPSYIKYGCKLQPSHSEKSIQTFDVSVSKNLRILIMRSNEPFYEGIHLERLTRSAKIKLGTM